MKNSFFLIALLAFTGCAGGKGLFGKSYEVTPGAERVRVLDAEPKGCLYVGEVASIQEDRNVGTLETQMELETRVDLRNKAHALGGNILVFLKGKNTNTLPGSAPAAKTGAAKPADGNATQSMEPPDNPNTLVFLATVFKCPSSVLNQ
ncbi:MAG: hypothetical protein K0R29_722 [Pseudobdellovibrio sp.]|jgi:hypothetical protein|nr:hypothetical protein [Pseudobdellovibrio sp.]